MGWHGATDVGAALAFAAMSADLHTDAASLRSAVEAAWGERAALHSSCETYRAFDGRFEGAPGWTLDRYGDALLLQCFGDEAPPDCVAAVASLGLHRRAFVLKVRVGRSEGHLIDGQWPTPDPDDPLERPGRFVVREDGMRLGIDLVYGQNPGLFLDARPLRRWVRANTSGLRVLNLFAYTGSFGVAAVAGGAVHITNVDVVPSAVDRCRVNHELNGFDDPRAHQKGEVFHFLHRSSKAGRTWDLVIADPPPVRTQGRGKGRGRERGFDPRKDVRTLHRKIQRVLAPQGRVLAISAARTPAWFEEVLPYDELAPLDRGSDFPGERLDGMRALVCREPVAREAP
jgi:23S rRNA G2069 N7-methylase RlmK/C1962 C5-methylase RlmI